MKNKLVLKELSDTELRECLDREMGQYQKKKINHAISPIENPNEIKVARRNIARCLTEIRRRELLNGSSNIQ